jgi:hypothetical protein
LEDVISAAELRKEGAGGGRSFDEVVVDEVFVPDCARMSADISIAAPVINHVVDVLHIGFAFRIATLVVDPQVPRDPEQEGRELRLRLVAVPVGVNPQEHVLGAVFGRLEVPAEVVEEVYQRTLVALDELREGGKVAVLQREQQGRVVTPFQAVLLNGRYGERFTARRNSALRSPRAWNMRRREVSPACSKTTRIWSPSSFSSTLSAHSTTTTPSSRTS